MRRNILFGTFFVVAIIMLTITLVDFPSSNQSRLLPAPERKAQMKNTAKPEREALYKQQTIQQDMQATEQLSRSQVIHDVQKFLQSHSSQDKKRSLKQFLRTHPEIQYAEFTAGQSFEKAGTIDASLTKIAKVQLTKARKQLKKRYGYCSQTFTHRGTSYFVLSHKAKGTNEIIVALISTEVVQAVERHQRRNLRIVPYPSEGRYRIESVTPGTNNDITVRTGEDNGNASHYAVDEIVVKFRSPLTNRQLLQLRAKLELSVVKYNRTAYVFRSKKFKVMELKAYFLRYWNPVFVEPHYLYLSNTMNDQSINPALVPNDTLYSEYQWNLPRIATENGWDVTKGSKDVVVAVLDTGVQSDHPDLHNRLVQGINIVDPSSEPEDDVGHGTHVAGIIAAEVNNNEGVAGMTWYTKIMPIKVLDSTGAGSTYSVAEGIIWATDHGAQIINMSLGNYAEAEFLHEALQYAYDRGVVLIAASGNDSTERPGYPAAYPEVFAVSATDPNESLADYSNYGDYIDVVAPGTSIPSTYPGSRYAALSGTSMASPHVAALASLVLAVNPQLSNEEIMETLRSSAKDLGPEGKDNEYGYGQIDVRSALQSASGVNQAADTEDNRQNSLQSFLEQVRMEIHRLRMEQLSE